MGWLWRGQQQAQPPTGYGQYGQVAHTTTDHGAAPPPHSPVSATVADALHVIDTACSQQRAPMPYPERALLFAHVGACCELFPGLRPVHASLLNWPHPLLALSGTIPIIHDYSRYNIPVVVYVLPSYPHAWPSDGLGGVTAPVLAFVTPTAQMVLCGDHPHLDPLVRGQCVLGALRHWTPHQSSLLGAVSEMAAEFSHAPPVHSLPSGGGAATGAQATPLPPASAAYAAPAPPAAVGLSLIHI